MDLLLYCIKGAIAALGFALLIYLPVRWFVSRKKRKKVGIWYVDDGGKARRE